MLRLDCQPFVQLLCKNLAGHGLCTAEVPSKWLVMNLYFWTSYLASLFHEMFIRHDWLVTGHGCPLLSSCMLWLDELKASVSNR